MEKLKDVHSNKVQLLVASVYIGKCFSRVITAKIFSLSVFMSVQE